MVAAIKSGRISQKRIEESGMRVLTAKARVGLASKKLVDLEEIHSVVNSPESNAVAQQIADRAITLVRNDHDFVPLKSPGSTAFFVLQESRASTEGQAFALELKKRSASSNVIQVDTTMSDADLQAAVEHASQASQYVVAAFVSVSAYRGNVALGGGFPQMLPD